MRQFLPAWYDGPFKEVEPRVSEKAKHWLKHCRIRCAAAPHHQHHPSIHPPAPSLPLPLLPNLFLPHHLPSFLSRIARTPNRTRTEAYEACVGAGSWSISSHTYRRDTLRAPGCGRGTGNAEREDGPIIAVWHSLTLTKLIETGIANSPTRWRRSARWPLPSMRSSGSLSVWRRVARLWFPEPHQESDTHARNPFPHPLTPPTSPPPSHPSPSSSSLYQARVTTPARC